VQLVSKISNLCDPDPPTLQTDGQHAISIPRYALVHRAVKIVHNCQSYQKLKVALFIDHSVECD